MANKPHNCLHIYFVCNDPPTKLQLVFFGLLLNYIGSTLYILLQNKYCITFLESEPKIEDYENFLKKYSSVLHPNHVIFIDKKYTLAKMYGRMSGYEASDMSDEQFQRKRQLCQDVLGQWFLREGAA